MSSNRTLTVRVERITRHTAEVSAFELVHPWGGRLPAFEPGAHIDVHTPGGFTRQYSLAQADDAAGAERRYVIGVKREPMSRGGSAAMHERVRAGDLLAISAPRCGFALQADARHHLLLAGGIGITPLLAMAQHLQRRGGSFKLCVFSRSRTHLPFADGLAALAPNVALHFDEPSAAEKIDLHALLATHRPGEHLYLCGPAGFMQAARRAASTWPEDAVHLEHFAAPEAGGAAAGTAFEMRLARRGITLTVAAGQTAVEALHDIGIEVPTSCEQGLCGTCVVGWLPGDGGEPEHHDFCLPAAERAHKLALCCARGRGGVLVVDL
jgi:vanillate O-demethylase ferredoxin subunit